MQAPRREGRLPPPEPSSGEEIIPFSTGSTGDQRFYAASLETVDAGGSEGRTAFAFIRAVATRDQAPDVVAEPDPFTQGAKHRDPRRGKEARVSGCGTITTAATFDLFSRREVAAEGLPGLAISIALKGVHWAAMTDKKRGHFRHGRIPRI